MAACLAGMGVLFVPPGPAIRSGGRAETRHADPASGELLGYMPQALSHLLLPMAAHQLGRESTDN